MTLILAVSKNILIFFSHSKKGWEIPVTNYYYLLENLAF
ncbi:hypothetical protein SIN_1739 [Streptococcus infantis SK1302]|uniref:Uncharacterized protein n=1 Tax=Streptococcus infantis SK1302 TaxID=871237 RepID=A0ABP2J2C8_9STRE|nr:hypothetical protein SIN_1739 [Streptococcus infantis SK1302]